MRMSRPGPSHRAGALAGVLMLTAGTGWAQEGADPVMMEQGAQIYGAQCAICHGEQGQGVASEIPSLAASPVLEDPYIVIANVHQGVVNMPPFPQLSDDEIAAVTTFVRNSFDNNYGGVAVEEVASIRAELDAPGEVVTIWDGVYTREQAEAGRAPYSGSCGLCHGRRLNGVADDNDMQSGPPLAGNRFLRNWNGRSIGSLFTYTHFTMPLSNPGFLPDEDYAAIIAYMLEVTDVPAGDTPLSIDPIETGHILITQEP